MGKGHRRCEVCGIKEARQTGNKLLFSKFPLEQNRCREWLRTVGNEELVHLPIEKLHEQRNVCAYHFRKKDFNKKGNRLKRHAIPSLNLMALPLTDRQLAEFPLHVYQHSESKGDHYDHNYYSKIEDVEDISEISVVVQEHPVDHLYLRTSDIYVDPPAPSILNTDAKNENPPDQAACEQSATPEVLGRDESPRAALCDAMLSSADDDTPEPSPPPPPLLNLHTAQMCRVCLALDVKMFHLRDAELKIMFRSITGIQFQDNEGSTLGSLICWECAARLRAASTFRSKALLSDTLLQRLIDKGEQIENEYFETVKEEADRLVPPKTLTVTEIIRIVDIEDQNNMIQLVQSGDDDQHSISDHSDTQSVMDDNLQMDVEEDDNVAIATEIEDHTRPTCSNTEDENITKVIYNENPEFIGISAIEDTVDFGSSILLVDQTGLPSELTSSQGYNDDQIIETFGESITTSRNLPEKNKKLQNTNKRTREAVSNDRPYDLKEDTEGENKKKKLKTIGGTSKKVTIRKAARNTQVF